VFNGNNRRLHCVCLRPQPGKAEIERLTLQEKGRQAATLAMFGHHSVAGGCGLFKQPRLPATAKVTLLAKPGGGPASAAATPPTTKRVLRATSLQQQPQVKQPPAKKPSSRFFRVCLTGDASKLLCLRKPVSKPVPTSTVVSSAASTDSKELTTSATNAKQTAAAGKKFLKETQINNLNTDLKIVEQNIFKKQMGSGTMSCKMCSKRYKVSSPHKSWKEAVQASNQSFCEKCRPLFVAAAAATKLREKAAAGGKSYKCDICNKVFGKRTNMIRHMTNNHPLNIHKVDLAKFATCSFKTPRQQGMQQQQQQLLLQSWPPAAPGDQPAVRGQRVKPLISA